MSEARELAAGVLTRSAKFPVLESHEQARFWVVSQWPDWREHIGLTMLDNVAECVQMNCATPARVHQLQLDLLAACYSKRSAKQ
jgi:hypothetical protein